MKLFFHPGFFSLPWMVSTSNRPEWRTCGPQWYKKKHSFLREKFSTVNFTKAVENFSGSTLGESTDALRAFSGILSFLFDKDHRYGLPLDNFDKVIFWKPDKCAEVRLSRRNEVFPSWSWSSVKALSRFTIHFIAMPLLLHRGFSTTIRMERCPPLALGHWISHSRVTVTISHVS